MNTEETLEYWRDRALKAEVDAGRYRWLRDGGLYILPYDDHGAGPEFPSSDELDIVVDDMIKQEEKSWTKPFLGV